MRQQFKIKREQEEESMPAYGRALAHAEKKPQSMTTPCTGMLPLDTPLG